MTSAQRLSTATTHERAPVVLRCANAHVGARALTYEPHIAQLGAIPGTIGGASLDARPDPAHTVGVTDLAGWCEVLAAQGYQRVRTPAMEPHLVGAFEQAGFEVAQELTVLHRRLGAADPARARRRPARPLDAGASPDAPASTSDRAPARVRRLRRRQLDAAAAVDRAAFGSWWGKDAEELADVIDATPVARARCAGSPQIGFLISGRHRRSGYVQRLAVHPDHRRRGHAHDLISDALAWMRRWRVEDVYVNTAHDNEAALALYRQHGFRDLPRGIVVMERAL